MERGHDGGIVMIPISLQMDDSDHGAMLLLLDR